ncbi:MAG: methylmalonyl-CoA mutase [Flavobacteriaceae bacterium]|nr:methylmalonyl-CoA mutase [Flavobacteriaceae bacterium]
MTKSLFSEFEEVSAKQWKQKIQFDLKGADYNDTLVWQSLEGIHVKPFYHQDDFKSPPSPIPGHPAQWKVAQAVFIDDVQIANSLGLDAIKRGAESIEFTAEKEFEYKKVFERFNFSEVEIYFTFHFLKESFLTELIEFLKKQNAKVHYRIDLLGNLAATGNWFSNNVNDHQVLNNLLSKFPSERLQGVDISHYQNAGANIVQQLAYGLAQATEYFNFIEQGNKSQKGLTITMALGSNYFFEIAKIRAFRKLYACVAKEFGIEATCHIFVRPSKRNKTIYDYNVNMLRTTTECMSGILGGANTVCNLAYDAIYHKSNEFGERISRNQLLILKSESYFDKVSNPSDGSYYIESLTEELAQKALTLFKEIEDNGGFLKSLKEGIIQKKIKESATKEQALYDSGALKLIGTTHFQNEHDRMKDNLELYPFLKRKVRQTVIEPINETRISETIEKQRIENE